VTSVFKEMDRRNQFQDDILLVNSHNVTNIDISEAISAHNKRKDKDIPMLMTKILINIPLKSRIRNENDLITVVEDCQTGQIIKYECVKNKKRCNATECIEFKKKKHFALDVRMGLLD